MGLLPFDPDRPMSVSVLPSEWTGLARGPGPARPGPVFWTFPIESIKASPWGATHSFNQGALAVLSDDERKKARQMRAGIIRNSAAAHRYVFKRALTYVHTRVFNGAGRSIVLPPRPCMCGNGHTTRRAPLFLCTLGPRSSLSLPRVVLSNMTRIGRFYFWSFGRLS